MSCFSGFIAISMQKIAKITKNKANKKGLWCEEHYILDLTTYYIKKGALKGTFFFSIIKTISWLL